MQIDLGTDSFDPTGLPTPTVADPPIGGKAQFRRIRSKLGWMVLKLLTTDTLSQHSYVRRDGGWL